MKVCVIGNGGREHAIAWRLSISPSVEKVYAVPGSAAMKNCAELVGIDWSHTDHLIRFLKDNKVSYNEKCFVMQDYEIWTQISAKQGQFRIVRKALVQYRSHQDNISNRSRKDKAAQRRNIQFYIQKKYLEQLGLNGENDISEYLKIYGKEYEETSECINDNYMHILKEFYEGLLENSKSSEIFSYPELKKYLRKRYFLYALKCNGNKLGQCIESFKLK